MQEIYAQINPITDRLFIMNQNGTLSLEKAQSDQQTHIGRNIYKLAWITKSKIDEAPHFF